MATPNPNGAASPPAAGNLQASGERLVDVAEVLAPTSNRGPQMQDLAQTQSDQVVDVEGAESSPADPVEVALAIGLPTEIDAPSTEDSGEPLIDLMNLTLEEVMELKVIPKVYSSHGPSVDPTTFSLAQLMRTKVLSDILSDTDDPVDLVAHKMADLLGMKVVMSGGSTSLDRQSFDDLIALSLSELLGVSVGSKPISSDPADDDSALNRKHEGTGLGLPLSKALAEMHGGSLDLQSTVGSGTTVTVRIPPQRIRRKSEAMCSTVKFESVAS